MTTATWWATDNGAGGAITISTPATPTAGHGLIAFLGVGSGQVLTGVQAKDAGAANVGAAWTQCAGGAQGVIQAWYLPNCPAGIASVLGTLPGSAPATMFIVDIDDLLTAAPYDSSPGQRQQTTVTTFISLTSAAMAQAREIAFAVGYSANNPALITGAEAEWTLAAGAGITSGLHDVVSTTSMQLEYKIFTAGGTAAAGGSCLVSADPFSAIYLFKLQAAAAPGGVANNERLGIKLGIGI